MKSHFQIHRCAYWLAAGCLALTIHTTALAQQRIFIASPAGNEVGEAIIHRAETRPLPKFWIGMMGEPTNDVLRSQLHLKHGVVVTDIVENSPAATAGLQKFDIVLKVNDNEVSVIEDFFAPVEAAGGAPLKLEVMREGKSLVLEVRPTERPAGQTPPEVQDRFRWQLPFGQPQRLRLMGPGIVLQGQEGGSFPDNVQISIAKHGNEPAKISIQRGEESWETTEDKLEELPAEVRGWVEPMLPGPARVAFQLPEGGPPMPGGAWTWSEAVGPFQPHPVPPGHVGPPGQHVESIQQQLDALSKQIHDLEAALKALQPQQQQQQVQ